MQIYAWLAVVALAVITEASTNALIAIWFAPSALVCMLLSALNVGIGIQIPIFIILSGVFMLLFYKKLRDNIASKSEKTNLDALIGKMAIVEEDIEPFGVGRVKAGGISWSAYSEYESETIKKGEHVTVKEINGVKLLCEKVKAPAGSNAE